MEKFETSNELLKKMQGKEVVSKRHNPLKSIALIVIGILIFIIVKQLGKYEALQFTLYTLAFVSIVIGIIFLIVSFTKKDYYLVKNNKKIKSQTIYISKESMNKIHKFIATNDFSQISKIKKEISTTYHFDVKYTSDYEFCLIQVAEYIPHEFVVNTAPTLLNDENAKNVINFIDSK